MTYDQPVNDVSWLMTKLRPQGTVNSVPNDVMHAVSMWWSGGKYAHKTRTMIKSSS